MKEPVGFVVGVNQAVNGIKLVVGDLECMGEVSDHACALLHQLDIIFEMNFTSLGVVAEGGFKGNPDLVRGGESNSFLCEGGDK